MLWIFLYICAMIALAMLGCIIITLFDSYVRDWRDIGKHAIWFAVSLAVALVCLFGITKIHNLQYDKEKEIVGEWQVVSEGEDVAYFQYSKGGCKGLNLVDYYVTVFRDDTTPRAIQYKVVTTNRIPKVWLNILTFGYGKGYNTYYWEVHLPANGF